MMISTKGRYALRVMTELAVAEEGRLVPLKEIAKKQEISEKYLEAVVKGLVREGMVFGMRGKGGGYRLVRKPEEYTLLELLEATEGSLAPVACLTKGHKTCSRAEKCVTLPIWRGLDEVIQDYFSHITLAELLNEMEEKHTDHVC